MEAYENTKEYYWSSWNNCEFSKIFNLTEQEFDRIYEKIQTSYVIKVAELYNKGLKIIEIAKELKIDRNTVR